jgi:predicted transcriptional regulator
MRRKITVTVNIEADQVERMEHAAKRLRLNRSLIVRQALEHELNRLEQLPDAPIVARSSTVRSAALSRS